MRVCTSPREEGAHESNLSDAPRGAPRRDRAARRPGTGRRDQRRRALLRRSVRLRLLGRIGRRARDGPGDRTRRRLGARGRPRLVRGRRAFVVSNQLSAVHSNPQAGGRTPNAIDPLVADSTWTVTNQTGQPIPEGFLLFTLIDLDRRYPGLVAGLDGALLEILEYSSDGTDYFFGGVRLPSLGVGRILRPHRSLRRRRLRSTTTPRRTRICCRVSASPDSSCRSRSRSPRSRSASLRSRSRTRAAADPRRPRVRERPRRDRRDREDPRRAQAQRLVAEGRCAAALELLAARDARPPGRRAAAALDRPMRDRRAALRRGARRSRPRSQLAPDDGEIRLQLAIALYHARRSPRPVANSKPPRSGSATSARRSRCIAGLLLLADPSAERARGRGVLARTRARARRRRASSRSRRTTRASVGRRRDDEDRARAALERVVREWPGTPWATTGRATSRRASGAGSRRSVGFPARGRRVRRQRRAAGTGRAAAERDLEPRDVSGVWQGTAGTELFRTRGMVERRGAQLLRLRVHDEIDGFDTQFPGVAALARPPRSTTPRRCESPPTPATRGSTTEPFLWTLPSESLGDPAVARSGHDRALRALLARRLSARPATTCRTGPGARQPVQPRRQPGRVVLRPARHRRARRAQPRRQRRRGRLGPPRAYFPSSGPGAARGARRLSVRALRRRAAPSTPTSRTRWRPVFGRRCRGASASTSRAASPGDRIATRHLPERDPGLRHRVRAAGRRPRRDDRQRRHRRSSDRSTRG